MEFGSQNLSFGDFSNLSDEEHDKVFAILHRSRGARDRKVEFPWDNVDVQMRELVKQADHEHLSGPTLAERHEQSFTVTGSIQNSGPDTATTVEGFTIPSQINEQVVLQGKPATDVHPNSDTRVDLTRYGPAVSNQAGGVTRTFQHSSSPSGYSVAHHDRSDDSSSGSARGSTDRSREVTPTDGNELYSENGGSFDGKQRGTGRLLASMKTYERRNKKKRTPGYYEKIAAQEEAFTGSPVSYRPEELNYMLHNKDNSGYHKALPPMVAPPTSHQPQVLSSPVMLPAGGFTGLRGGMVPMFSVPPGYPMSPFQGGVSMPMHPPGVPLLASHMQQQHGLLTMPPPPAHMTSPVNQHQHGIPMEMTPTYQRNPVDTRPPPIVSQDVRQHPPGFGMPERSPQRQIMPQVAKTETHYMRRPSPTEKIQPKPQDSSQHRHVESSQRRPRNSPPIQFGEVIYEDSSLTGCAKDNNIVKVNKDVKYVHVLDGKTEPSVSQDSRITSPCRTSEPSGQNEFISGKQVTVTNSCSTEPNDISANKKVAKAADSPSKKDPQEAACISEPGVHISKPEGHVKSVEAEASDKSKPLDKVENLTISDDIKKPDNTETIDKSVDCRSDEVINDKRKDSDASSDALTVSSAASVPAQAPKPQVSWAGLFKGTSNQAAAASPAATGAINNSPVVVNHTPSPQEDVKTPVPASEDSAAKQLGELLDKYQTSFEASPLQPRGLTNRGNWCYVNAILQALLACPALNHLLQKLPNFPALTRGPSSTPILDSLVEFVNEFYPMQLKPVEKIEKGKKKVIVQELIPGPAFEPANVYKMLQVMESSSSFKGGKQEDAEEFLSFVLNGLHEEMAAAIKQVAQVNSVNDLHQEAEPEVANGYLETDGQSADGEEEDQWEQVGPRNKSVFTRKANFAKTPVSDIFAGQIRSAVFQAGSRESAMLEPFFTLQLDIQSEKVYTVKEALEGLVSKESVQGFTCSKTKTQVEVTRRTTLEELPPVLILHLKFFIYDKSGGCQKLLKKIDYATDLEINRDLLSPNVRSKLPASQRNYKLFAVVYHHGKNVTGGHYTTDVYHTGINSWIHMDDSNVKQVNLQQVLKFVSPRVPYLLYYRRMDLV
ncbi:uncharacterized protein LOC135475070 [Liolophura sinensis]|uniref:uncharacterized protein LOC135475070 n=1 Tax=Liolophura sinensis TaxID=3198878 RepID=UPI00315910EC